MRISLLTVATLSAMANAKLGENEVDKRVQLSPAEMGAGHTEAFNKLAELYKEKRPTSKDEMMEDLTTVVISMCESNDVVCEDAVRESIKEQFELSKDEDGLRQMMLPDDFDEDNLDSINSMFSVINTVNVGEDINDILEALTEIEAEIESSDPLNPAHKTSALVGLAVAKESAKLWHDVYKNKSHPLHRLHHADFYSQVNRNLDEDYDYGDYNFIANVLEILPGAAFTFPDINVTGVIIQDIETAIELYSNATEDDVDSVLPFGSGFVTTIGDILAPTIAASASVGSDSDPNDEE